MLTHADLCDLVAASYSQKPTWLAGDDIRAVGTQVGPEFVVACPGTTDLAGWLADFRIRPKLFPYIGAYHEGFGLWGLKLAALVLPTLPAGKRILFIGHSLGGQVALVLAAAYAAQTGKLGSMRVVVFGCPRGAFLGNFAAGALLRSALELFEYRNHGDPIPNVPPAPLWKHATAGTYVGAPISILAESMSRHAIDLYQTNVRAAIALAPPSGAWRAST